MWKGMKRERPVWSQHDPVDGHDIVDTNSRFGTGSKLASEDYGFEGELAGL
jgi:hypothetical protein